MENKDSLLYYIADKIGELCHRFQSLEKRLYTIESDMHNMNQRQYRPTINNQTIHNPHHQHLIIPPPPRYSPQPQYNHMPTTRTQTEPELTLTMTHQKQITEQSMEEDDTEWITDDEAMEKLRSPVKPPNEIPPGPCRPTRRPRKRNTQKPKQRNTSPFRKTPPMCTGSSDLPDAGNDVPIRHGWKTPPPVTYNILRPQTSYFQSGVPPYLLTKEATWEEHMDYLRSTLK